VALVELLTILKKEFFHDLEVQDEGGYWETRDLAGLTAKRKFLDAAMDQLTEGLNRYGLNREAAEDQEILVARIERIARLVQRTLARPAEHPPVRWDDEETGFGEGTDDSEAKWDDSFKENRRRQEHVQRAIEEHLAQGDDFDDAFDAAMLEETALGLPEEPSESEPSDHWADELEDEEEDEPWRKSLPETSDESDDDGDFVDGRPRHPLQRQAFDLMLRLNKLLGAGKGEAGSHQGILMHGAGEIMGGLAQALEGPSLFSSDAEDDLQPSLGLSVVQLKRALRGAAFALGALFPLRTDGTLNEATFGELHETIERVQTDIFAELSRLRQRREGDC
jgi:hypothetical protein